MKNYSMGLAGAFLLAGTSTLAWAGWAGPQSAAPALDRAEVTTDAKSVADLGKSFKRAGLIVADADKEGRNGQGEGEGLEPGANFPGEGQEPGNGSASLIPDHKAVAVADNDEAPGQEMKEGDEEDLPPGLEMLEEEEEASLTRQTHADGVLLADADKEGNAGRGEAEGHEPGANFPGA